MNITIISGSPRKESTSFRIALHLKNNIKMNAQLVDVRVVDLPFVDQVWSNDSDVPSGYKDFNAVMKNSDAFILVTPEYNGVFSPALNNLLCHFPKSVYMRKPMAIVSSSTGAMGGMRSALHLQQQVAGLFGILQPQMLVVGNVTEKFDEQGNLIDLKFKSSIDTFCEELYWLVTKLRS